MLPDGAQGADDVADMRAIHDGAGGRLGAVVVSAGNAVEKCHSRCRPSQGSVHCGRFPRTANQAWRNVFRDRSDVSGTAAEGWEHVYVLV
jgi:hypothetical protein